MWSIKIEKKSLVMYSLAKKIHMFSLKHLAALPSNIEFGDLDIYQF